MEYLEIQDKVRAIVLTAPKHHLVQQLALLVADLLKELRGQVAELVQENINLRAQLADIRATDNGTLMIEEEL